MWKEEKRDNLKLIGGDKAKQCCRAEHADCRPPLVGLALPVPFEEIPLVDLDDPV